MEGALQTAGTVTPITGVAFVAVEHGEADALMIGESLVAFQLLIDQEDGLPELVGVESGGDPPQGVGAGQRFAQPLFPEARGVDVGQSVEAGQTRPEQDQSGFDHGGSGTTRIQSAISQRGQQRRREGEDFFAVADEAAENG
jgi:hypothetical protein